MLRVLTGLLLLLWLLPLAGQADALFGLTGWIDREVLQAAADPAQDCPHVGWSILYLAGDNPACSRLFTGDRSWSSCCSRWASRSG